MPSTCGFRSTTTGIRDCPNLRWKEGATYCKDHEDEYRAMRRSGVSRSSKPAPLTSQKLVADLVIPAGRTHAYVVHPELQALWDAELRGAQRRPAGNFLFVGPSGSGKTDGAESLAASAGLEFTKVDAASMTDPESWFGTREIVVQDGVAVTDYRPSGFVESIQKPGVTFIDEITRCHDEGRNIVIPVLDHTRQVTNPLTGEVIHRHPQNFIIMAGNVGVNFTGTSAVDPAFWTRATKVEFDYIDEESERVIVQNASGCDAATAYVLVAFALESRAKARSDEDFPVISTRELIRAGGRVADGLDRDLAVKFEVLNGASGEGGGSSVRTELQTLWNGVRTKTPPKPEVPGARAAQILGGGVAEWVCPDHGTSKQIPAGVSARTSKPYGAFMACSVFGCPNTEDNTKGRGMGVNAPVSGAQSRATCSDCGTQQPVGRTTICVSCGATL